MARKRRKRIIGGFNLSRHLKLTNRLNRLNIKNRRSRNYWIQHDDKTFSKVILLDVERLWLEVHAPGAVIEFKKVAKPELYPRYKSGFWNGMAYFVTFPNAAQAGSFKMTMWTRRRS